MPKVSRWLRRSRTGGDASSPPLDGLQVELRGEFPSPVGTRDVPTVKSSGEDTLVRHDRRKYRWTFWSWLRPKKTGVSAKSFSSVVVDGDADFFKEIPQIMRTNSSESQVAVSNTVLVEVNEEHGSDVALDKSVGRSLLYCKLCLSDCEVEDMWMLKSCGCAFCKECLFVYIGLQVSEGVVEIGCPDGKCPRKGNVLEEELKSILDSNLYSKFLRFKLQKEVDLDPVRIWCPTPDCETLCSLETSRGETKSKPTPVTCPTCKNSFCSACQLSSHGIQPCTTTGVMSLVDLDLSDAANAPIKKCPACEVLIERDNGCAQMMCRKCKHVFCWYCLTSLDDDFLLRHYDKGACKNMLGHSRASLMWHRAQVIGIFAGFGVLLLVASPLLLLAAPCVLCCRCKTCDDEKDRKRSPCS